MIDHDARETALDVRKSFIVQAPAGSGKTTLLTKRFIGLLSTVNHPEEILAVTFTRKAAAQMRHRIITALSQDHSDDVMLQKVIARNKQLEWRLIQNPNRLRIMTIDALCALIAHQMPLMSHSGGKFEIASDPAPYYQEAIVRCLVETRSEDHWYDALKTILFHFDNKISKLKAIVADLLAKRDQWLLHLPPIQQHQDELKIYLSEQLQAIAHLCQSKLEASLSLEMKHALKALTGLSLTTWEDWKALSTILLTLDNDWRKQFNQKVGFLSPSSATSKEEKASRKAKIEAMHEMVSQLSEIAGFQDDLVACRRLPPIEISDEQSTILTALGVLLPVWVAYLNVVFKEAGRVDFTEVTLSALQALGDEVSPTEVVLKLDYQIQHILIDEYQDTSVIQYKLFEKLVSGWQPHDGRTLFVVGDPMQSIYRFRGAEVNLFLKTQQQGLGGVHLQALTLKMNFRSIASLVNWNNTQFKNVFPPHEDLTLSAVPYSEAVASSEIFDNHAVLLHALEPKYSHQADYTIELLESLRENPQTGQIAILVRARRHLLDLIPLLKKKNIAFIAHEVDHLAMRPHIIDLMTLLRATQDLTDNVAWWALLRSPLFGLTLDELLHIKSMLNENLLFYVLSTALPPRVQHTFEILKTWMNYRKRDNLSHYLRGLWMMLGGYACYPDASILKDFEIFFSVLESADEGGILKNSDDFEDKIATLYADCEPSISTSEPLVELMTIHKAKGLEFDTVILPHTQARSGRYSPSLLLWQELTHSDGVGLLLGTSSAVSQKTDALYDYIVHLHKQKERNEIARLFYVGATRAKKQLHIIASPTDKPSSSSFWGMLPAAKEMDSSSSSNKAIQTLTPPKRLLTRLKPDWQRPVEINRYFKAWQEKQTEESNLPEYTDPLYRRVGTLFHLAMQGKWYQLENEAFEKRVQRALKKTGLLEEERQVVFTLLRQAIHSLQACPTGQWIIDEGHQDCHAEWSLSISLPHGIETIIIDYAFVDAENIRWVIDYKMVQTQDFSLDNQIEQYRSQIRRYANALRQRERREVRAGLYFPLQQTFAEIV